MRQIIGLAHNRRLIAYLAFLSAFAPLSTDMYLPALPRITELLHTSASLAGFSISGFLLLFACSTLVWGSLSDVWGRRPVLLAGILLYIVSSAACALAENISQLLMCRGGQAVGSGAISAVALAVVKDVLHGDSLERIVAWIQTVTILAPMLAPVAGGALLMITEWRGVFWCLMGFGLLALAGICVMPETLPFSTPGGVKHALGRVAAVLRHRNFRRLLLLFSATNMPFLAYLAVSSYVFQRTFGLSAQQYSLFFAFNAVMSIAGPLLHTRIFRHRSLRLVIAVYLVLIALAGGLLCIFGTTGACVFALLCAPTAFCVCAARISSTVLLLNQLNSDNGTVAALVNSGGLLCGSLAMLFCTLPIWSDYATALGVIALVVGGLSLPAWLILSRDGVAARSSEA